MFFVVVLFVYRLRSQHTSLYNLTQNLTFKKTFYFDQKKRQKIVVCMTFLTFKRTKRKIQGVQEHSIGNALGHL